MPYLSMAYFMFESKNAPAPVYADSETATPPAHNGPWICYQVPDLPVVCNREMMLEAIQHQGYSYLILKIGLP